MAHNLDNYRSIVGDSEIDHLKRLGAHLKGAEVVHVNSTREGGGVAEIINWLKPMMEQAGLKVRWEVIDGNPDYFHTTKTFHNALQGKSSILTEKMISSYEDTVAQAAEKLHDSINGADFVIIHDPQPAALMQHFSGRKNKWIWRCHIDVTHPDMKVWNFIKSKVVSYNASIFSMPEFAQMLPHPQFIIAPSIDPLSDKNCDVEDSEVRSVLEKHQIPTDLPILTQISRFDRFKDPLGVIKAFKLVRESVPARLVLAGGGASDDPEGQAVFEEVQEAAEGQSDIHLLMLPSDAHRTINCLQRASDIILQKSLQEGFGLTVTEALWKAKPVIGGNVGGIRVQVHNHNTGFLVNTPEGAATRLRYLLVRPDELKRIGETAKIFIRDHFLLTRHLREYLTLLIGLKGDHSLTDHIFDD